MGTALISFADASLGGTSRSAAVMGKAWRSLGYDVVFCPREPVPAERSTMFSDLGALSEPAQVSWDEISIVHFHHAAGELEGRDALRPLIDALTASARGRVPLLTHNVFGSTDRFLNAWSGPVATGVLGRWAAWQYHFSMGSRPGRLPWVVPNPQDPERFFLPSEQERRDSRAVTGASGFDAVLRIGSPSMDKWSMSYVALATALPARSGARLFTVGAPDELASALAGISSYLPLPRSGDDAALRQYYWAADVFALDARRGESFGNVIMESLMSGTPVVYRAHVNRDNTPWEFRDLPGFTYTTTDEEWIAATQRVLRDKRRLNAAEREKVVERYAIAPTAHQLGAITASLADGRVGRHWAPDTHDEPGRRDRAAIWLAHCVPAAAVKEWRRSRHHR